MVILDDIYSAKLLVTQHHFLSLKERKTHSIRIIKFVCSGSRRALRLPLRCAQVGPNRVLLLWISKVQSYARSLFCHFLDFWRLYSQEWNFKSKKKTYEWDYDMSYYIGHFLL